jgi:hypothetical protein
MRLVAETRQPLESGPMASHVLIRTIPFLTWIAVALDTLRLIIDTRRFSYAPEEMRVWLWTLTIYSSDVLAQNHFRETYMPAKTCHLRFYSLLSTVFHCRTCIHHQPLTRAALCNCSSISTAADVQMGARHQLSSTPRPNIPRHIISRWRCIHQGPEGMRHRRSGDQCQPYWNNFAGNDQPILAYTIL